MIRSQRSPYGTSLLGAGAVHHIRLAQRIPVRIRLTQVPEGVLVSAGMTCTVIMKDGMQPRIGASMKYLIATMF